MTYTERVDYNLKGLEAVSISIRPGCEECASQFGYDSIEDLNDAYESGQAYDEGSFSTLDCDICGSRLSGTRLVWHGIPEEDHSIIYHFDAACVDCAAYLANGTLPESE